MTDGEWYGLGLGFLGVFAVVAGICAERIGDLIGALASRVRYGKVPYPDEKSKVS